MRMLAQGTLCVLALLLGLSSHATARALTGKWHKKCTSPLTNLHCDAFCQLRRARIVSLGLMPGNGATECFTLYALGTQNYECAKGDGNWTLTTPNAVLFGSYSHHGEALVSHFFLNPPDSRGGKASWESNEDGSRVTTLPATAPVVPSAPSPDGSDVNIPWLSTVKSSGVNGAVFGKAVAVVRADTRGGVAPPASECDLAGRRIFVPYSAAYLFYE